MAKPVYSDQKQRKREDGDSGGGAGPAAAPLDSRPPRIRVPALRARDPELGLRAAHAEGDARGSRARGRAAGTPRPRLPGPARPDPGPGSAAQPRGRLAPLLAAPLPSLPLTVRAPAADEPRASPPPSLAAPNLARTRRRASPPRNPRAPRCPTRFLPDRRRDWPSRTPPSNENFGLVCVTDLWANAGQLRGGARQQEAKTEGGELTRADRVWGVWLPVAGCRGASFCGLARPRRRTRGQESPCAFRESPLPVP